MQDPLRHADRAAQRSCRRRLADALAAKIVELPAQLRRSLTWDQGKEMAAHARFTTMTGVTVYFCDPAQSLAAWQQREHQWALAPILPEALRDRALHPSRS